MSCSPNRPCYLSFFLFLAVLFPFSGNVDLAWGSEPDPAIYLMIDTSGSMLMNIDGSQYTYGDGSLEHFGVAGDTSRFFMAKEAIRTILESYGEVRWGMARFQQNSGFNYLCSCSSEIPNNTSGCGGYGGLWDPMDDCRLCDMMQNYPDHDEPGVQDRVCINYAGGILDGCLDPISMAALTGADILVPVGDGNVTAIIKWVNHSESDPGDPGYNSSWPPEQQPDPELRATGGTPLGGSLQTLYNRLASTDIHADPLRGCRPYRIILLTDGAESCGTDPVSAATLLRSTPDLLSTCTSNANCPPNSWCEGGRCRYDVKTHVIAFAVAPNEYLNNHDIGVAGGTGGAIRAQSQAELVAAMAEIIADSIVTELCNGLDDDCDGEIDEDFPELGLPCDNGQLGACHRTGVYVCSPDQTTVVCDAPYVAPTAEICDGIDNDCNGLVDDGLECPTPGPEMCNGIDDDLDPSTPDGADDPAVGQVCGSDVGICEEGITKCIGGSIQCCANSGGPTECGFVQGPMPETCNNLDDNCNGSIDEGLSRSCYPGSETGCTEDPPGSGSFVCTGACRAGIQFCDAGAWGSCQGYVIPQAEICDGIDNNCNGSVDEGLGSTTCGLGVCEKTVANCVGGVSQTCDPMEGAEPEICDGLDNDCNGLIDDGLVRGCYAGSTGCTETIPDSGIYDCVGRCAPGTSICVSGIWTDCSGGFTPQPEECNGLDDNCNGSVDEDLTRSCYTGPEGTLGVGVCTAGTQACTGGAWGSCIGEIRPSTEACNNLDDNCDGIIDNMGEITCGVGICEKTVPRCVGGEIQTCDPMEGAQPEICNNIDDNCDGLVDQFYGSCYPDGFNGCTESPEGSGNYVCLGACQAGSRFCSAGLWGPCSGAITPQPEICDGIDNNCSGVVDDGLGETTCGLGICQKTVANCVGGVPQTCDPMEGAQPETCNNLDDDCNGIIDDGLVQHCYPGGMGGCEEDPPGSGNFTCKGVCRPGTSTCTAGVWGSCVGAIIPSPEECNGLDDNCDGTVDEDLTRSCYTGPAGTLGVGTCIGGTQTCSMGAWGTCVGEIRPKAEECNSLDDNCDGIIDNMGDITCGVGVCEKTVPRCIDGVMQTCDPMEGAQPEICNNIDDNCDGLVDQFYGSCYPEGIDGCTEIPPDSGNYVCLGACQAGSRFCSAGLWGPCSGAITPQPEICDGIDNNCSGVVDDGLGETTCGLGICHKTVANCVGGVPQTCDPMEGAQPEICDGLDNDCNGLVDDGLVRGCYPEGFDGCAETIPGSGIYDCVGRCTPGVSVCNDGSWSACSGAITPQTEECNGLDDNCNGSVDEGLSRSCYTGPAGTLDVGVCTAGTQSCFAGAWGTCTGEVRPSPEVCNNLDDNCDGEVDNMGETTCGLGICEKTVPNCVDGVLQTCDPMEGAQPEICDGLDNDCDGQVDGLVESCYPDGHSGCTWNALTNSFDCVGVCAPGQRRCPIGSGTWGPCENAITPTTEVCDGLDNNCDGNIDEDLTENCYPPGSGEDTGCEEQPDGSWVCEGECRAGVRECTLGAWTECLGLVIPTSEICDNLDNNCDGRVDEDEEIPGMGQPCGGVGVCAPGIRACIDGVVVCDGGGEPEPGLCDGIDNNCNGQVDEPAELLEDDRIGTFCGTDVGECTFGSTECIAGEVVCVGGVQPQSETCNGLDNDCNGLIDDGDLCEENHICFDADCRLLCDPSVEQSCPTGFACIEPATLPDTYLCYPQLAPCAGVYCGQFEVCRDDECVNPCEPDPCQWYERCWVNRYAGQIGHENEPEYICFDDSCSAPGHSCPYGQFCVEHTCVTDPCRNNECDFLSEYCERTDCETVENCGYVCRTIPFCNLDEEWNFEEQRCEKTTCAQILCPTGEVCVDGNCETDPCLLTSCDWGEVCAGGNCLEDPCQNIRCPSYAHCTVHPMDGTAWCAPNPGVWTPPVPGDTMTTRGGGCTTGNGTPDGGLLAGLVLLFLLGLRRVPVRRFRGLGTFLVALVLVFSGCDHAEFSLQSPGIKIQPDADVEPDVEPDADVDGPDCIPTNEGVEICDGIDNDCNGVIDDYWAPVEEGGQGHFMDDPFNCGSCGNICSFLHAQALCVDGECEQGPCHPGWYDFNPDVPGCETSCTITGGGVELCDGVDNDCNGIVDDPWIPVEEGGQGMFMTDPLNCGECGRICTFANGTGACVDGECLLDECNDGFAKTDPDPSAGCNCRITADVDDTCDGIDNNCSGTVDDGYVSRACYTGTGCVSNGDGTFTCQGQCTPGYTVCSGGREQCIGQVGPALEVCDGVDNNCNGAIDEGYDLMQDVNHCGGCNHGCTANAPLNMRTTGCVLGVCQYVCQPGFYNIDTDIAGCEYECTLTNNGVERCDDGIDNDCNGVIDEFDGDNDVLNCGSCNHRCSDHAPPNMVVLSCTVGVCSYECAPSYFDYDSMSPGCETFCQPTNGGVEICDGIDNDCNGLIDETFDKDTDILHCGACNHACADHPPANMTATGCVAGNCQYECNDGTYNLDGLLSNGCEYECTITNGGVEICDGLDNNCDGRVDLLADDSRLEQECYTGPDGTLDVGICRAGTQQCYTGSWGPCTGQVLPVAESCDGIDNNCDGNIDEAFDLNTNLYHCGECSRNCTAIRPPNTNAVGCMAGECLYQCVAGFHDLNDNRNVIGGDGCEYECTYTNGGVEICDDGLDNNCNGQIDEFDGDNDILNCGTCGHVCQNHAPPNMNATGCSGGTCQYVCQENYHDFTTDPGCETYCVVTNGGVEICDGLDNNCNGDIDEGFDTQTDVLHCGGCNHACADHAPDHMVTTGCVAGNCQYECQPGFLNLDGLLSNGCEYECTVTNGGVEICDGLDNNCDGRVDQNPDGTPLSRNCYTGPDGTLDVGLCRGGTQQCFTGSWSTCTGQVLPQPETCDGLDNNCSGTVDDGFDLDTDILHCGACGQSCFALAPPNASVSGCVAGECQFICNAGFHDLDGDLNNALIPPHERNGCEYECTPTASPGVEFCDGLDNDCDGQIDEVEDLVPPPSNYCKTGGECGSSVPVVCEDFMGDHTWVCQYPSTVDRLAGSPNQVAYAEVRCDGLDNNCDGSIDEAFWPVKGSPCEDDNLGVCKGTGYYVCKADQTGTECFISNPGQAPGPEICDGLDNDCDGLVDEPAWNPGSNPSHVQDDLVAVNVGTSADPEYVFMYRYEASRPTATASEAGFGSEIRSCSKPGVIPWSRVTFEQARQACQRAGMDLCEADVWEEACDGENTTRVYPYGNTYNATACWGEGAGVNTAQTTGSKAGCVSAGYGAADLSGNLREWVNEIVAWSSDGKAIYQTRGGSYRDGQHALACGHDTVALTEDAFIANVGFRCCTRCGNGILDPGELCDDGNRISGDGCSAVCGPDTCGNGVQEGLEECDCGLDPGALPAGCIAINGAPNSNCNLNCTIPEERCSVLYPEDQNRGGQTDDCLDPACAGTRCGDVIDNDGDGFAAPDDCDDNNPNIHPGMDEICDNGIDDNCNGFIDNDEPDKDGDGYLRCVGNAVYDCDDWDPNVHPGRPEICGNGIDENCDGSDTTNCATACEIAAYERSYIGCEYWPTPTVNSQLDGDFNNNFGLVVTNDNSTSATVQIYRGTNLQASQTINANSTHTFLLPLDLGLKSQITGKVTNAAYRLTSTIPVTVYQFNPFDYLLGGTYSHTNDASLLLPTHVLGTNYYATARQTFGVRRYNCGLYNFDYNYIPGFISVVGTENSTTVSVTYSAYTQAGTGVPQQNPGNTTTYSLARGEVLQVLSRIPAYGSACGGTQTTATCAGSCSCAYCDMGPTYDMTGTYISSNKPVAVFSGHNCSFVPYDTWACDHLEQQMLPLETWGRNFVATFTAPYTGTTSVRNRYRVLASMNGTTVTFHPSTVSAPISLNAGEYAEVNSAVNFSLSADKPVSLSQYMLGQNAFPGTSVGDPAMGLLVPTEQFRTSYSFTVPSSMTKNFVSIIKPVAQAGKNAPSIFINGNLYTESPVSLAIGNTYYGVYRVDLSVAPYSSRYNHSITSTQPFGIIVYGFSEYTSYMYPGGLDLNLLNIVE